MPQRGGYGGGFGSGAPGGGGGGSGGSGKCQLYVNNVRGLRYLIDRLSRRLADQWRVCSCRTLSGGRI